MSNCHFYLKITNLFYNCFYVDTMARGIREEISRLYKKKQLHFHPKLESNLSDSSSDSSSSPTSSLFSSSMRDKPLFTFRQVRKLLIRYIVSA